MSRADTVQSQQIREAVSTVLGTHGRLPNRTLARILVKKYPYTFASIESARGSIKHIFGMNGNHSRRCSSSEVIAIREEYEITPVEWPDPIVEWKWEPYQLPQLDGFWLIIADLHIPFHEMQPILTMVKYAKKLGKELKGILINGDLMDQYTQSWWAIDSAVTTWDSEIRGTRQFFAKIRAEFPHVQIKWKWSNHEYRFDRTVLAMKPALVQSKTIRKQLHLLACLKAGGNEHLFDGVEIVEHENIIQFKDLAILHGNEFGRGITTPVNPARTAFLKTKACCFVNHSHQSSQHAEQNIWGVQIVTRSGGCFCEMHPRWNRTAALKWNHGFALLETRGKWDIQNKRIMNDKVVTA